jgi:hypothetical protein
MTGEQSQPNPVAVDGVEVIPTADGYVIYDEDRDRVHYLNHTAALVLEFCTGDNTVEEIVELLQRAYELPEPPDQEARDCVAQLRSEGLLR